MSEEHIPQLSLVWPTAHGWADLIRSYPTIQTNLDMEIIFVGPTNYIADDGLLTIPHRFIVSPVKVVQCLQIGMYLARGETVGLVADGALFSPYAWDEAYSLYKEMNDYKAIASMNWWEHGRNYKSLVAFKGIQLPTSCSVMSRKFFWELRGYDSSFIKRQADMELFIRAVKNGARVEFCKEEYLRGIADLDDGRPQHLFPSDHALYEAKWAVEDGKLVQKIEDHFFEFNDTIYTISQGARDSRWP